MPGLDSKFAAAGRTGSGAYAQLRNHQEKQLGGALGDLATGVYGGAYEQDQGRRMQALGMQGTLGQQDVANRLSGAGLYNQGTQNMFGGIGLGPQAAGMQYGDAQQLFNVGSTTQNAIWDRLQKAQNIASGLPAPTTSTLTQNPNPFSQLLGMGVGLGGIYSSLFGGGRPDGSGVAAQLRASDRRLKRDIVRIGTLPSGLGWYRFRYVWGEPSEGVMAQEVMRVAPEAVIEVGGYLMVDYGMLF